MNYPFRSAAAGLPAGAGTPGTSWQAMETLRENYPRFAFYSAMNCPGHPRHPRILTLLGVGNECRDRSREWRSSFRMDPDQRRRGKELLKLGAALLFAFPGSPTVYYGDEAGMEGFEDPFNRRTFPWGQEDSEAAGLVHPPGPPAARSPPPCAGAASATG
ncbi:MAG: alpha-amylase family glycosyl hydrolase [Lawsonibacter sp.]